MDNYWESRALLVENENYKNVLYHNEKIKQKYMIAEENIQKEINHFYEKFAINNQISLSEAKTLLNNNELKEFRTTLGQYKKLVENDINGELTQTINNISIKQRVTRLQQIQYKIDIILEQLEKNLSAELNNTFFETIENSYYKTMYAIENKANMHTDFTLLNDKIVNTILTYNWSGVTYSDRIWRNQEKLKQSLNDSLNKNFIQGNNVNELSSEMSKLLNTNYKNCTRLLRTEVNYMNNKAAIETYKEKGIEKYQYVAVLDLRTSEICSSLDGEIYEISEMTVGVNCPPMHPNCRSTIIPYIEEMTRNRTARNIATGKSEEVGNLNYKQWYEKYVEDQYTKEEIDALRKRFINYASDKKQYTRYKEFLKTYEKPVTFANFQNMKYNDKEAWQVIKSDYILKNYYDKVIDNGYLSPLVDFGTYRNINEQISKELVGIKTINGIQIKSYSKHFVDRVCGSIEQKRSGVAIEDIKNTLLTSINYKQGVKSIKVIGTNNIVSLNPEKGSLIQVNPKRKEK